MNCQLYACKQQAEVKVEQTYSAEDKVTLHLCPKHAQMWLNTHPKTSRKVEESEGGKA